MKESLLYITRKTKGIGGMQRLSHDFMRAATSDEHCSFSVIHPYGWLPLDITFPIRAITAGASHALRRHTIHLGDALLCPLIPVFHFFGAKRVTITACGLDVLFSNRFYQKILIGFLSRADAVVCISAKTAEEVRKRGVPSANISVIPCGIHANDLRAHDRHQNNTPVLLCLGRLVPRKGVAWFLEKVFPILRQRHPTIGLHIIGDGSERVQIEHLCDALDLRSSVKILGQVTDEEKERALVEATLFIMPNIPVEHDMEGFGIVCIEASARGLPVVAARLEGIKDAVIEGRTGTFFTPLGSMDAVRAIEQALSHSLSPDSVRTATLEHFDWKKLFDRYCTEVFAFSPHA